jgi:hypothetical protein
MRGACRAGGPPAAPAAHADGGDRASLERYAQATWSSFVAMTEIPCPPHRIDSTSGADRLEDRADLCMVALAAG